MYLEYTSEQSRQMKSLPLWSCHVVRVYVEAEAPSPITSTQEELETGELREQMLCATKELSGNSM